MNKNELDSCKDFENKRSLAMEKAEKFPPPYIHPILRLLIYLYIVLTTGWTGMQELLYKGGTFEDLCIGQVAHYTEIKSNLIIDCPARKSALNQLYTIQFSTNITLCFVSGLLLDFLGPKLTFVLGQLFGFAGFILIGLFPKNGTVLRIFFFAIGSVTEALYIPLTTASLYFPKYRSLVISIMGSVRSLSFFMPSILSAIYLKPSVRVDSLKFIMLVYGVIAYLGSAVIGAFIVQRRFFDNTVVDEKDREKRAARKVQLRFKEFFVKVKSLVNQATHHKLFFQTILFTLAASLHMAAVEFMNMSQREILMTSTGKSAVDIFRFASSFTFLPGIIIGFMVDKIGSHMGILIMQFNIVLAYICTLFDNYSAKVASCFFYITGGCLFLSIVYFYSYEHFPTERLGVLFGSMLFFCGILILLNIPIYDAALKHNTPHNFSKGYMAVSITSALGVVYLKRKSRHFELTT